jgi:2-polyprenyl-3-methyl-5-hydroxy-6-metoxy-1,4-benzoquinol methylase
MAWSLIRKKAAPAPPRLISRERAEQLLARYKGRVPCPPLSYATVEDYCDSVDHLPEITGLQGDLKDVQRPWTAKAILGLLQPGATLVEIGAGRPEVAQLLTDCGYHVIAVDPYEGAGNGPTEFEVYRNQYPAVDIRKTYYDEALDIPPVDAVYSISTLEHVPDLRPIFRAIRKHLKPGGLSLHCVDIVVEGKEYEHHHEVARQMMRFHGPNAGGGWPELMDRASRDLEAYFLGPSGHQLWRHKTPYSDFPFRKVLSLQVHARAGELNPE